jgi:signal peptidase I
MAPLFKSIVPGEVVTAILALAWLAMLADACRRPVPRLPRQTWLALAAAALVVEAGFELYARQFTGQPFRLPTGSMQPTLLGTSKTGGSVLNCDHVVVNRMAYYKCKPRRGDIVVFKTSGVVSPPPFLPRNQYFAKRIVGLPGDRVSIRPPFVCINGRELADPPFFRDMASGKAGYTGYTNGGALLSVADEIVLGQDEYFVLGDNSCNSLDSRHFGPIKADSIVGQVNWIYWPPDRRGVPE